MKNINKKFNELKFENLLIIFFIFLFIENNIITSVTSFLIYNLLMHFIIMNKNCFFRLIIRNMIINQYIYSFLFVLFVINDILLFNFLDFNFIDLLLNIVYVIVRLIVSSRQEIDFEIDFIKLCKTKLNTASL